MEIIPAIDLINGKCVRLRLGDYAQKTEYGASPLEMAKRYQDHGIRRLHLVDLDGAKAGKVINWEVAETLSSKTSLTIDFGGGVKTKDEVKRIIDLGIRYVVVGSIAAKHPEVFSEWIQEFGADRFMLGADVMNEKIMVSGWLESSNLHWTTFVKLYANQGVKNIFCTDISKDGMLQGPATALYAEMNAQFPDIHLIASGGISSLTDIESVRKAGCKGAIIGKAIYENRISLEELQSLIEKGNH